MKPSKTRHVTEETSAKWAEFLDSWYLNLYEYHHTSVPVFNINLIKLNLKWRKA